MSSLNRFEIQDKTYGSRLFSCECINLSKGIKITGSYFFERVVQTTAWPH